MLFSTVKGGFPIFLTFAGAGLSSAGLIQGTVTFGIQQLQKHLIRYLNTYFLISGYFAMAPFIILILGKMSIDDDMIFSTDSIKLIAFLCTTTLVCYLYWTGALSTKSSPALPQQWEVRLMMRRRRHQQMVCRSCFFGGLVCTEQLWGPCLRLEHGVVIRTSTYSIDVESLLSGVNSPVSLPALCGFQMADGRADIWDGEEDNLIEIFLKFFSSVIVIRRSGFLHYFPVLVTKL